MPIDDGCREVFVGDDLGGQPMAHDLHQVAAGEKFGRIAMGYALLGQEQGRDHDQGHVMVPRLPAADLILCHAAGALGLPEGLLDEVARFLHFRQTAQGSAGFGIGQAELEFRPIDFPSYQEMPAACRRRLAVPVPYPLGEIDVYKRQAEW